MINPSLLIFAEKLQYEGYVRREETNATILALKAQGIAIKEIVRRPGYSRGLIRKILRGQRPDVFRVRQSSLDPYLPWLDEQWEAGRCNGAALWRALRLRGFRGCLRVVSEWSAGRKKADQGDPAALARAPSARTVARLLTVGRERLSKAETITVAAIENGVAVLVEAREIILELQGIIRRKALAELDTWISRARGSLVAAFANGVSKDKAAIEAAIALSWSNGQTESQLCKLKLVKRQMYGRGNLDLLQARVDRPRINGAFIKNCVRPKVRRRLTGAGARGSGADKQAAGHSRLCDSTQLFLVLAAQRRHLHRASRVRRHHPHKCGDCAGRRVENPRRQSALRLLRGINVSRNALAVFLVSGGIAGLAGAEQVLGVDKACHDNFSPPLRLRRHRGRHAREEQPYWRHLRGLSLRDDECGKRGGADDDGREQVSRLGAALHHCSRAGRAVLFLMACALALAGERRVSVCEASWTPT